MPSTAREAAEALLGAEPRVDLLVVHAHRPTHHDEPVEVLRAREMDLLEEPGRARLDPARLEPGADAPEPFERDVLERVDPQAARAARHGPHHATVPRDVRPAGMPPLARYRAGDGRVACE